MAGGPPRDAWAAVLWENVVVPTDEPRRDSAFAALRRATGLEPARLAAATDAQLAPVVGTAKGAAERLAALRACARVFAEVGDPRNLVAAEREVALEHLCAFPGIDAAIAARILLLCGHSEELAFDAHGLRAIVRIGYGDESGDEDLLRRTAHAAAADEILDDVEARVDAVLRLRRLGLSHCRKRPHCDACTVANLCETARIDGKNR